ncbi:MAG: hypothetical protein AAF845_06680 [Bacteroidota bacterium]
MPRLLVLGLLALSLSGCAALAEMDLEQMVDDILITPDEQRAAEQRAAGPTPAPVEDPLDPPVPEAVAEGSPTAVTLGMMRAAEPLAGRVLSHTSRARTFDDRKAAIETFDLTEAEKREFSILGFRTVTIEVGGGGNSPYLVGASLSQGVAFGLRPGDTPQLINSGGFSLGVPGAGGGVRLGFWKAPVDDLAGWLLGVNGSAPTPKGVDVAVGVFWSVDAPPTFQGFNIGAELSTPGPGGDAGLAWTEYTQQILNTASDAGRVLTGNPTRHGAEIGERCTVGTDCRGYIAPVGARTAGTACCNGTCQQTQKDYAGISWCPSVCKSGPFARPGSC